MKLSQGVLPLLIVTLISGCGGTDSSSDANGSIETSSSNVTNTDAEILAVSGIYNTSRAGDENYLYIDSTGEVIAYDYQADSAGSGSNCYSVANDSSQTNSSLNDGFLSYSTDTQRYTITANANTLEFEFNTTDGMFNFTLNSMLSAGTGLNISSTNLNVNVGGTGSLQTDALLVSDIEAALCE